MLALKTADHTLTRPSGPCPHPCGIQRISSTANAQGLRGLAADIGGNPVCPVPSKNSAAVPHLAIFPMLFSYTFHKDISPDCYSKFRSPGCHVPSKNSLSLTLSARTVVPTAIRTFVLHPVALLASFPSSKNSAAAPHLWFFRRLFTLPSMVQSSQIACDTGRAMAAFLTDCMLQFQARRALPESSQQRRWVPWPRFRRGSGALSHNLLRRTSTPTVLPSSSLDTSEYIEPRSTSVLSGPSDFEHSQSCVETPQQHLLR